MWVSVSRFLLTHVYEPRTSAYTSRIWKFDWNLRKYLLSLFRWSKSYAVDLLLGIVVSGGGDSVSMQSPRHPFGPFDKHTWANNNADISFSLRRISFFSLRSRQAWARNRMINERELHDPFGITRQKCQTCGQRRIIVQLTTITGENSFPGVPHQQSHKSMLNAQCTHKFAGLNAGVLYWFQMT